jgi:hypothetical protein
MNLKTEQILRDIQFTERYPRIYSDGVYLVPMKIQINGIDQFVWIADEFNDDIFDSDGNNISVKVIANTIEKLYV